MNLTNDRVVRIACATGGETDGILGMEQLLRTRDLQYIFLDALAEPSMVGLGREMTQNPDGGFSREFADAHLVPYLAELKHRNVCLITNAGGLNPAALAAYLERAAERAGTVIRVASISGDNLLPLEDSLRAAGVSDMFSGRPFPDNVTSINAYLGAFPIAEAIARGADVVLTGRAVDSGLALGALIHEFKWCADDHDLLAAGTAIGHLLECGAQVCGGIHTDWWEVDWEHPAYPIAECLADGTAVITKPEGSGGLVSVGTVSEQLLYEVGNPQAYVVPDVVCDFTSVHLEQVGPHRVRVSGARGYPPTESYKVLLTYDDGWRATALSPIIGMEALAKATRRNEALLRITRRLLRERNLADWQCAHAEVLGAEASYGARSTVRDSREVVAKIVVEHQCREAVNLFVNEERGSQMYMAVGTASGLGAYLGAPRIVRVSRLFSFLIDKARVAVTLRIGGVEETLAPAQGSFQPRTIATIKAPSVDTGPCEAVVPLVRLAWGRSGDKGDIFNVAVIARAAEFLPYIRNALAPEEVREWFAHFFGPGSARRVERYEVPGVNALNFVLHEALLGGVASGSPLTDRSAKGMAQQLLEFPIPVPQAVAARVRKSHAVRTNMEQGDLG